MSILTLDLALFRKELDKLQQDPLQCAAAGCDILLQAARAATKQPDLELTKADRQALKALAFPVLYGVPTKFSEYLQPKP